MTKEELIKLSRENLRKSKQGSLCECYDEAFIKGYELSEKRIAELEAQIEKLIDFVLSKTECCDVCPITDTCLNGDGTCPYAGILSKGEEEVTREWLVQKIAKEIKENDNARIIRRNEKRKSKVFYSLWNLE